jgi:hypothetical protein
MYVSMHVYMTYAYKNGYIYMYVSCVTYIHISVDACVMLLHTQDRRTPLHEAAYNGDTDTCTLLISHMANVNATDEVSLSLLLSVHI